MAKLNFNTTVYYPDEKNQQYTIVNSVDDKKDIIIRTGSKLHEDNKQHLVHQSGLLDEKKDFQNMEYGEEVPFPPDDKPKKSVVEYTMKTFPHSDIYGHITWEKQNRRQSEV